MAFKGLDKFLGDVGNNILHSNKAINGFSDLPRVTSGSIKQALNQRIMDNGSKKLWERLGIDPDKSMSKITNMQRAKSLFYHRDGNLALGRIAGVGFGGAGTVSGAYSMVANGSPVRDRNGDFDVPGIPLI